MTIEPFVEVALLHEEIARLREDLAGERARRVELLAQVADTLERLTEEVRQMAREQ